MIIMYCGTIINENSCFCGSCGAAINVAFEAQTITGQNYGNDLSALRFDLTEIKNFLGADTKMFLVVLGLFVLQFVLMFQSVLKADILGLRTREFSVQDYLGDDARFVWVLGILFFISAFILMVLPLLTKKSFAPKNFILTKISVFYSIIMFMSLILSLPYSNKGRGIDFSLMFMGYIYIIVSITLLVTVYKLAAGFKKRKW